MVCRIGALVTNSTCAYDERIGRRYPLLRNTILSGASPQLRNAATTGGNLLQRTRCYYFYDVDTPCNKRQPGSGCPAIGGVNRIHAILGTSDQCIATNPSDMNVAHGGPSARTVNVRGPGGERPIPILDFHRLPGDTPEIDTTLRGDELITSVDLPDEEFSTHYTYLKLRDRASYAFALVSVAAALRIKGGVIAEARVALGGVAHKPWRLPEAEALLQGVTPNPKAFGKVADALLEGAMLQTQNAFKIPLARRAIVRALKQAADGTPAADCRQDHLIELLFLKKYNQHIPGTEMTHDCNVPYVGRATSRVDGPLKVTGGAKYAAEYAAPRPSARLRGLWLDRQGSHCLDRHR